jgi:phosphohistidine phosphatase
MQRLILMRHGKAERASAGVEDIERRLTRRGVEDAALIGRVLKSESLIPDMALVSDAKRTEETWAAVSRAFPAVEARRLSALYLAEAPRILAIVEQETEAETVMVIGHNPGLHELALWLLINGSAPASEITKFRNGFPTATAAVFHFDAAGRAAYDGLFLARDFGGGGAE